MKFTHISDKIPAPGGSVRQTAGPGPGARLAEGTHALRYRATDAHGAYADCSNSFIVKGGWLFRLLGNEKLFFNSI